MKSKIIFILLMMLALQANSQVTLNSLINPIDGDSETNFDCDTAGVFQGSSGGNQSWSYMALTTRSSTVASWMHTSSTPYAGQFPSSNIASTIDLTNYSFFSTSISNILVQGFGSPFEVVQYSNPEVFMEYPFTYNSYFADDFSAVYMAGSVNIYRTGTITAVGDAYGTLTLPAGTYSNALRVKYNTLIKDSSYIIAPNVIVSNTTSYVWFVPNRKFPVFQITYSSSTYNGIPQYSGKFVNYNSNSTSIGVSPISSEVPGEFKLYQNYPNPFNPSTKIKFDVNKPGQVRLAVYDLTGREVSLLVNSILKAGSYEYDFDGSSLSSGVYFYKLIEGGLTQTRKLTLIK